jgi:hypothetical protein
MQAWWAPARQPLMPLVGADDGAGAGERKTRMGATRRSIYSYREALPLKLFSSSPRHGRPIPWSSPGGYPLAGWIGIASTRSTAVILCG